MYADFSLLLNLENFDKPFLYVITPTGNDCESEIHPAFEDFEKNHQNKVAKLTKRVNEVKDDIL